MPPPPPDPVIELVLDAPEPSLAPQPDEPTQEPAPPAAVPPAPPPTAQPDAAPESSPSVAAAAASPDPPIRVPAIRTRSELRRILTPPPARGPSDPQMAAAQAPAASSTTPAPEPHASAGASSAEATFEGRVREAIQAALRVPPAARMMGLSGRARVRLGYRDGALTSASLDLSTGSSLLDDAALRAARDAAYPSPPPELEHRLLNYVVWVQISVR